MKDLLQARMEGFRKSIQRFNTEIGRHAIAGNSLDHFKELIAIEMNSLGFDEVEEDSMGTPYGIIKGIEPGEDLLIVSHMDAEQAEPAGNPGNGESFSSCKPGIISALYAAGVLKRAMLPLRGDLIICCLPRALFGLYAMEHFYEEVIKVRSSKIKGIILSEPTGGNINLGHKGRIEYEIIIKGHVGGEVLKANGLNMLGSIFPLVNELEKVSSALPHDSMLGRSSLRIKDIRYNNVGSDAGSQEFRVAVDRVFIPEETAVGIIDRAKNIANNVYSSCDNLDVKTSIIQNQYSTPLGMEESSTEFKPWVMQSHHPFVLSGMQALYEGGFNSSYGYWQKTFTEGSVTFAKYGIPTIGFGPGDESSEIGEIKPREIERSALGQALIIHRNIGVPSFGWSEDEI